MNYLGHLYLSGNRIDLMQANLYGDFIKGSHLSHLPEIVREGIQLHRAIDHFIDHHPVVQELLPVLRPDLPKIAPIAVDLYFDHLLAKHWDRFHPQPLTDYLAVVYAKLDLKNTAYSSAYLDFLGALVRYNWISHYPKIEGLDKLCRGVSSKLSFANALVDGKAVFLIHEKAITAAFFDYMTSANEHFLHEHLRILS